MKRIRPAADHDVEGFRQRVDRIIRRAQAHLDIRMLGAKPAHPRQQPAQAEGRERIDAQHRDSGIAAPLAMLLHGRGNPVERRREFRKQGRARRRQHHATHRAPEQRRRTQPFLEQADLLADRAMSHTELGSGFLEAAEPCGGLEGTDRIERRQAAAWDEHVHLIPDFLTHDPIITDL